MPHFAAAFRAVSPAPHLPLQGDEAGCLVSEPSRWPIGLRDDEMGECAAVTCSDGPFGSRCTWRRRVHDPARVWMAVAAARLRPPNITGQLTSPGLSLNARACTEAEKSNRFIR